MKGRFSVIFPLFFAMIAFAGFERTIGSDHVRAVQILSLIGTGMCIGVAIVKLRLMLGAK